MRCRGFVAGLLSAAVLAVTGGWASSADRVAWIDDLGLHPGRLLVVPPPSAGAVVGVDEQRKMDSYSQTITLAGDRGTVGENVVAVTVVRDGLAPRVDQAALFDDMQERIPAGVPMAMEPPGQGNVFGLFGAATGSRGAMTCLYGWQSVSLADRWITGKASSIFGEPHALSIRIRLCRTRVTPAALTAVFASLRSGIASSPSFQMPWSVRDGDALSAAAAVAGEGAQAVQPHVLNTIQSDATDPDPPPAMRRRPQVRRARLQRSVPATETAANAVPARAPLPGMPDVPLPP